MSIPHRRELLIVGAGSFGAIAAWVAEAMNGHVANHNGSAHWDVIGYADCDKSKHGTRHAGYTVHGNIEEVGRAFQRHSLWFFCAIGDNRARAEMVQRGLKLGWRPATLIHPSAIIEGTAEIGAGTCIAPAVVISCKARVGAHVVVDAHVSIGHNAVLMDFCEVFSGARVNGNCQVGEYALIGCNATLLPGTLVGNRAVVGANSVARGLVDPDTTIFGVPARVIRRGLSPISARERGRVPEESAYEEHDSSQAH